LPSIPGRIAIVGSTIAPKPALRIDVPVAPKASKVVFNMDHVAFAGDQSIGLRQMQSMILAYKEDNTPLEIIAVFHGAAGYMMLNDEAYEECVHTAEAKNRTNSNLLPMLAMLHKNFAAER
jgi:hypothetical protein